MDRRKNIGAPGEKEVGSEKEKTFLEILSRSGFTLEEISKDFDKEDIVANKMVEETGIQRPDINELIFNMYSSHKVRFRGYMDEGKGPVTTAKESGKRVGPRKTLDQIEREPDPGNPKEKSLRGK
ncbi:MAG: hypothetical protein AAB420_00035 [Patescibacteria group bacterium]